MRQLSASDENARTLASLVGVGEEEAALLLAAHILITAGAGDREEAVFAEELQAILGRTFSRVSSAVGDDSSAVEIILGTAVRRTNAKSIWVSVEGTKLIIGTDRLPFPQFTPLHRAFVVVAACYVSAAVARAAVDGRLPHMADPFELDFAALKFPEEAFRSPVDLGEAHLAGAGAIGNGFLWTLRHLNVAGRLNVLDADTVSSGNLNRQVWFEPPDVGKLKAATLAERAQRFFPHLKLTASPCNLQDCEEKAHDPRWLKRLIVGVDSRRARRHLQSELPREVFDASTTGVVEIVLHFNRLPSQFACMACVYRETPNEMAREAHVAESLGVSIADVKRHHIDHVAASKIVRKYPHLDAATVHGQAYDSLFKVLCGQQAISVEGQQVLAPFAFVSVLAGALLAIETSSRLADPSRNEIFNYWKVSPWHPPYARLQKLRYPVEGCEICKNSDFEEVISELWGAT